MFKVILNYTVRAQPGPGKTLPPKVREQTEAGGEAPDTALAKGTKGPWGLALCVPPVWYKVPSCKGWAIDTPHRGFWEQSTACEGDSAKLLSSHHGQQDSASPGDPRALQKGKDRPDTAENGDSLRDTAPGAEGDRERMMGTGA